MKNTLTTLFISCILLITGLCHAQQAAIQWWYDVKDASFGQSAAADLDRDGKLEIVFGCYRNDSSVYVLNAEDGSLLWKYNTHPAGAEGCNDVAPVIYDVDGDDSLEVVVPSSCNPTTFCFNGKTGAVKWQTPTRGSDSPPTIADLDNDGKPEILHGEFGGYVICLNAEDGSVAWEIPVDVNSWIQTAPTIVDADGDGQLDFIVGTWNNVNPGDNKVYAFRGDTHTLLWSSPIGDFMYHGSAVADLDHDAKPEIVLGAYNDTLYCLNAEDGSFLWKYRQGQGYYMGAPASIADLDKDGWCEVVFVAWYVVGALSHDGQLLWQYDIPGYGQAFRGVALADISGNDSLDVIFGTDAGKVIALNGHDGSHLWTKDLRAHYGDSLFAFDNAPLVADFNNDDSLDVFIVGGHAEYPAFENDFGRAYLLSAGQGSGPDWLMFQRDIWRQSSLCDNTIISIPETTVSDPMLMRLFPNPAAGFATLQFQNPSNENHSVSIYNGQGQLIQTYTDITASSLQLNCQYWPKGLYFLQLHKNKARVGSLKFVI